MMRPALNFSELIEPMTASEFFSDYYSRSPCLVKGSSMTACSVFGWDDVSSLLEMTSVWTGETLKIVLDQETLDPKQYCRSASGRDGGHVLRPIPEEINRWMSKGASVVLDVAEHMHPGLRSLTEAVSFATNTLVNANIYCSYAGHQAFRSHFDTTDVFVFQIAGRKKWRIYEGRFDEPYGADGFFFPSFDDDHHKRAKGKIKLSPTLEPGHFLYLPKGQYHDACATDGPSLHVTLATTEARGVDFLRTIFDSLVEVPEFRAALPDFDHDADHDAHIHELADKLHEILKQPGIAQQMREDQKRRAFASLARFDVPTRTTADIYRVRHVTSSLALGADGYVLTVDGRSMQVPQEAVESIQWIKNRSAFIMDEIIAATPDLDAALRSEMLTALVDVGLIDKLSR